MAGGFRTRIAVLTTYGQPDTLSLDAVVPVSALVLVVARCDIGGVKAPLIHVTEVVGARIAIVAYERHALALGTAAEVEPGAGVAVITTPFEDLVNTPLGTIATIGSARIAVVTIRGSPKAHPIEALVVEGTGIAVIAASQSQRVAALSGIGGTGSRGTGISILTGNGHADAVSPNTDIAQGAQIAVVTREAHRCVNTSGFRIAMLLGARVPVITIHRRGRATLPGKALVRGRARILIVAR
jgi:hypothetical protein